MCETKKTILIVEDDPLVRKSTAQYLRGKGYTVLEAVNGKQALDLFRDKQPNLLMTDLRMPELDGMELLKIVVAEAPEIPVIIVSGMGTMTDAIEALRIGAWDYITKPIHDMAFLLHSIERNMERAQLLLYAQKHQKDLEKEVYHRTNDLLTKNKMLEQEMQARQAQEALVLHAKQEWERTVDAMPDMIALIDKDQNIVRMNRTMRERLKVSYEDVKRKPCYFWFHGSQNPPEESPHIKTMEDGQLHAVSYYEPHLDSYLEVTTVPYTDPDGTVIGSVQIVRDISERKKQQENYERLFESSRDAIVVTNQVGFINCNKAALKMFGYDDKEEFLKLHPGDVSPEFQPDGVPSEEAARQRIREALEGTGTFFPWVHQHRDGTIFPAEVLLSPFEMAGELVVQGVVRDLSERQLAEKEKEKLQSQLLHAQKLESVGQLAAGIAHEINTPTQFIGTNIDFFDEAVKDITELIEAFAEIMKKAPPEIAKAMADALEDADWEYLAKEFPLAVKQSHEGVKRVTTIVRAMKEFSHPGSKEKEMHNLNRIIETTVTVARNEWKYVAEVELDLDEELPKIKLLADEIGQVILNVLVNAAHAIAGKLGDNPEGNKGVITIRTKFSGDWVELRITDTGSGIPETARARIFDPFYTTKEVGRGTGQGLAISHDVITEKHGGKIDFTTEDGKGTEFIILLPVNTEDSKVIATEV